MRLQGCDEREVGQASPALTLARGSLLACQLRRPFSLSRLGQGQSPWPSRLSATFVRTTPAALSSHPSIVDLRGAAAIDGR